MGFGRKRKRASELAPLRDVVMHVYPSKEPEDVRAIRAFSWWERAVPARVADNARPVRLERGVLWIHAATTVWANELDFLKDDLVARLRQVAPESRVRSMRIRVGKLPPRPPRVDRAPPPTEVVPLIALPEDVARALASVGDDDLRRTIGDAARASLGERVRARRGSSGPGVGGRNRGRDEEP
jgi:hypothetical protein